MGPKEKLHAANQYPFDATDEWRELYSSSRLPPPPTDWAHAAARGVVYDLMDRCAIKHGFSRIDESVRLEIISTLASIIREASDRP